mgnify:FL=1
MPKKLVAMVPVEIVVEQHKTFGGTLYSTAWLRPVVAGSSSAASDAGALFALCVRLGIKPEDVKEVEK